MKIFVLFFVLFYTSLFSSSLENLLQEYNSTNEKSLQTIDEKLGHVFIYSQKDIQLMQYQKLNDILKELPLLNLNKNTFGVSSLSLSGTKTTVSGFFKVFINDHEVSSIYNQSAAMSWGDLPLDIIDYVEIYYGESSFSLGNESGIYFIRLYTKKGFKENGNEINLQTSSTDSSSESLTNSKTFENGWSYLLYFNNQKTKETNKYEENKLINDADKRYLYLNVNNEKTDVNIAYTDLKKDNYMGLSFDAVPDEGEIVSKDFFVDVSKYFLNDNSLKANVSLDINNIKNEEVNQSGINLIPVLNLRNMRRTIPKSFDENLKFTKTKASISKSFEYGNNNFLTAINISKKKYDTKNIDTVNFFNQEKQTEQYTDFDEERINSILFQDDYNLTENLILIGNAKFDKYQRSGFLEDISEELYRVGAIYTPFENFGIKTFYTNTYLPPSFYNVDYSILNKNLEVQKYKFYTVEGVYVVDKSKFGVTYNNVEIDDFIYFEPSVGFMNILHTIKTTGYIYSYEYQLPNNNKFQLNYYTTNLSEELNNSNKGGYVKYMGEYGKFEYFTSVIYRNSYSYLGLDVDSSYDLSLGASYNVDKNLKVSLKGQNLFDNSTQSLYVDSGTDFAFDDYGRSAILSLKWMF